MWMLDTDICIALIKRQPPELITKHEKLEPGEVAISSIALAERHFGVSKSAQSEKNRAARTVFEYLRPKRSYSKVTDICWFVSGLALPLIIGIPACVLLTGGNSPDYASVAPKTIVVSLQEADYLHLVACRLRESYRDNSHRMDTVRS